MSKPAVTLEWTATAIAAMQKLPMKVRRGLFEKADELLRSDPLETNKALVGPLQGYYRITYGRYRLVYSAEVTERRGKITVKVHVRFVLAGIRKDGDKNDIYRLAQRLVALGIVDL